MTEGTNSRGNRYVEFPMATKAQDERVRVTLVQQPNPAWVNEPTIRIQKRNARGRLFNGPEFPASQALDIVAAIASLAVA